MKIKEVITKTGLTDRAIRLYIENELVKPEYDENYNGRKSIDFSQNDVEQLKNIALLRKADFSIQEIKALQEGGETAQNTIKEYINRTNEKIRLSSEILEKIGVFTDEKNVTVEMICKRLSNSMEDAQIPKEDMELSTESQFRAFFKNATYAWLLWVVFNTTFFMIYLLYTFVFPKHSYIVPTDISFNDIVIPVIAVYAILLVLVFLLSVFCLKNIGNILKNTCSVLIFRLIELGLLGLVVLTDESLICFVNWSIATLDYSFSANLGLREYDLTLLYGVTSFIPFAVMVLGITVGEKVKTRKNR